MLPPIRRVYVEIQPLTHLLHNGGVVHKVRVVVDSGGYKFVQELTLNTHDFESRFDRLFELAKRTLHAAIEREANSSKPQAESSDGEAQEAARNAGGVHAEFR